MTKSRYREVADALRSRVAAGEWQPGDVIPRMADLAAEYEVARTVVAAAVRVLETEGLLFSVPRKGTIVQRTGARRRITRGNTVQRRRPEGGYSFAATRREEPTWVHHITPFRSVEPITERAAELLKVEPGTPVLRRRRVTSPEGEQPFALHDSWIHPGVVEEAPGVVEGGVPGSYLDEIELAGHGPLVWHEITRCRPPEREEAALLRVPMRMPVMEISRVAVSARTGDPVDVTVMIIPSDRIEVVVHLQRDPSAAWPVEIQLSSPDGPHSYKEP